jgi:hypothetical protein
LVIKVLQYLDQSNLNISIDKYQLYKKTIKFLGYIISQDNITMLEDRIESIQDWKCSFTQKDIQSFLGFANFYWQFINNFTKVVQLWNNSTKEEFKGKNFSWFKEDEKSFNKLKALFTIAQIL